MTDNLSSKSSAYDKLCRKTLAVPIKTSSGSSQKGSSSFFILLTSSPSMNRWYRSYKLWWTKQEPYSTFKKIRASIFLTFSIKNLCSKCDWISRKLWIWSHLLKKSLVENFLFCAVFTKLPPVFRSVKDNLNLWVN